MTQILPAAHGRARGPRATALAPDRARRGRSRVRAVTMAALAVVSLGAIVASASATPARAQQTPSTTVPSPTPPVSNNPQNNTFSISPTGPDATQPGSRAAFAFELAPGTSADDSVTVWNYGDQARAFNVYARDAFNNDSGLVDLLTRDKQNTDLGGWIALSAQQVEVPAHSGVTVPFSVTAPRNATPGDHDAGIVVSTVNTNADRNPNKVQVENRVGTRVYLRVTGPLNPALQIEDVHTTYQGTINPFSGGDVEVTYTVRNVGNIRLRGHQEVGIHGVAGIGSQSRTPEDLAEMFPGTTAVRTERFAGVPAGLRITADVTITPFAPKASRQSDASAQPVSASASAWAIPWALVALLVAVVVVALLWRRSRRRGRAAAGAGRRGRTGPGDGAGPGGDELVDATVGAGDTGASPLDPSA